MTEPSAPGLIVAAPASGSGKTTVTLGLLRAFRRAGIAIAPLKAGPDYIDPGFHARAAGRPCANLDAWAMRPETLAGLLNPEGGSDLVLCEGVMGLFDGATATAGSTADIAARTGWPVVLVVDASAQAASAAAVVRGFAGHRQDVSIDGVIFNRVASERHRRHVRDAMTALDGDIRILGFLPGRDDLRVPSRHLGLVQAMELNDVEAMIDAAADHVAAHLDLDAVQALAMAGSPAAAPPRLAPVPPLGQRIAVADDEAFAFRYPHVTDGWRAEGAELLPFSPLAGEGPANDADAIYLAGGYPELHAGIIAANAAFMDGLRGAAARGAAIFGECGGYMALGEGLTDAGGRRHVMAGLLPVETSFADRRLHFGYRRARLAGETALGPAGTIYRGHEFHYASIVREDTSTPLFETEDAFGDPLPPAGAVNGRVAGSFIHLIDRESE